MKPYYDDGRSTIYCGDCRDILPQLPPIDLVLTDPPYNVGVNYGQHNDLMNEAEWLEWAQSWFMWCQENSQTLLITGQVRLPYYGQIMPWKWLLCWWKPAAMGRSPMGFCNWEPIALWGKGAKGTTDVIRSSIVPNEFLSDHPCPKPLSWAMGILELFPQANTILDPFMGTGTTLVAAQQLRRHAIGIEIEERYCQMAVERLAPRALRVQTSS